MASLSMATKLIFLLTVTSQVLGHPSLDGRSLVSGVGSQSSSSSYSSSSSSSSTSSSSSSSSSSSASSSFNNGIVLPAQELQGAQARLQASIRQQTAALNQAKANFEQQISGWYFPSPDLRSTFEQALATVATLIQQAVTYAEAAERLRAALQAAGSGVQSEWIERVRKLHGLGELALNRAAEGVAAVVRNSAEIGVDQQVYAEAKAQQLSETKGQMDLALEQLLEQTLHVGKQASGVLNQAMKEWSVLLRTHMGAAAAESAILRLREVVAQTLADLERLRPEDIETAMSDAHRSIEDIKGLFYSSSVPAGVVRQAVNPVQLGVFATLTRARNIH